jgi:hypothetical protein
LFYLGSDPSINSHGLRPVTYADSELKGSSNVLPLSEPENENPCKPSVNGIKEK